VVTCALALASSGVIGDARAESSGVAGDLEIAKLLGEIDASRKQQQQLELKAGELSTQRDAARRELSLQVRALYRITHPGMSPAMLGMGGILRHVGRVKRLRRIVEHQAHGLQSLETRAADLRTETGNVSQSLEQAQLRLAALKAADEAEFAGRGGGEHYGFRILDEDPRDGFEAQRGRLSSPVSGDVRIVRGRVAESDGPSLEFQAPVGTPVHAVAPGRVAFADRYGGYGRLVVIDHGGGYYTAYGGLGTIEVRVGDPMLRQARVGEIGSELSTPALLFEVRKGSRTLEPDSWLGY
jgi:septal ring factor EnvC (AmiA/AmiB activator)